MRYLDLNNNTKMPVIGLGTWKSEPAEVYAAVRLGLKIGYNSFDCAAIYHNEDAVGQAFVDAMAEDNLQRKDIFVTSKLWNNAHKPEDVIPALKDSLKRLQLDYLDLFLMHWPVVQKKDSEMPLSPDDMVSLEDVPLTATWQAMEEAYNQGLCKALGVSNFGEKNLTELIMNADIAPMVNQIESHPYLSQNKLISFCAKNMVAVTAYAPLGSGHHTLLEDETIRHIAEKNKVTPAQVLIAWNLSRSVAVIPKAVSEAHLHENIAALNLTLDADDIAAINSLDREERFLNGDVFQIGAYAKTDIFA